MPKDKTSGADWQRRPTQDEMAHRWTIWRVGARNKHRVRILSHDLEGCYTHWFGGRTQPCAQQDCTACEANTPRRWHGWLWTEDLSNGAVGILEITARSANAVDEYFRAHRTLQGATAVLFRVPSKANGKLVIQLSEPTEGTPTIKSMPDIKSVMNAIWEVAARKLTRTAPHEDVRMREERAG